MNFIIKNETSNIEISIKLNTVKRINTISNIQPRVLNFNINKMKKSIDNMNKQIVNEIVKLLHNIGMKDNLLGYYCFKEGIFYSLTSGEKLEKKYMFNIYDKVKRKYNKNINSIERNMRYAKESTWQYKSHLYIEKILGYSFNYRHSTPTNMELLLILTECIRITIGI